MAFLSKKFLIKAAIVGAGALYIAPQLSMPKSVEGFLLGEAETTVVNVMSPSYEAK